MRRTEALIAVVGIGLIGGCEVRNNLFCEAHPENPACEVDSGPPCGGMVCNADQLCKDNSMCVAACYSQGDFEVCLEELPTQASITLAGALDTASDPRCANVRFPAESSLPPVEPPLAEPIDACAIVAETISLDLGTTLSASGKQPLVLIGTSTVTIAGTLDVASRQDSNKRGPGGNLVCAAPMAVPENIGQVGGGGAGGAFVDNGGVGGTGGASRGGGSMPVGVPRRLQGGCPGQNGGQGEVQGGAGGDGGGAVYLVAGETLTITGTINASGRGGSPGKRRSGGGGGGSGGTIILFSPAITTTGIVMANGGGGASGGDSNSDGIVGTDPDILAPMMQAAGGMSVMASGEGGRGAAVIVGTGGGTGGPGLGGGGGGGGKGYVQSNQALAGALVSPAATVVP